MARFYSEDGASLQQHFGTEEMADLLVQAIVLPEMQDAERRSLSLATCSSSRRRRRRPADLFL